MVEHTEEEADLDRCRVLQERVECGGALGLGQNAEPCKALA